MPRLTHHDFDYPDTPIDCGPFRVTIHQDDCPDDPSHWEMSPPAMITYSDGSYDSARNADLADFFSYVSGTWCSRNWRAICDALDMDKAEHDAAAREEAKEWGCSLPTVRKEMFSEALAEMTPGQYFGRQPDEFFDTLAALYSLAGIPAYHMARNGYSQGQTVSALVVYTPEFCEKVGIRKDHDFGKDAEATMYELAAWSFGDCYGFEIQDADGDTLDSCFGYLGAWWDDDRSGLWAALNEALEGYFADHAMQQLAMTPEACQAAAAALHSDWEAAQ